MIWACEFFQSTGIMKLKIMRLYLIVVIWAQETTHFEEHIESILRVFCLASDLSDYNVKISFQPSGLANHVIYGMNDTLIFRVNRFYCIPVCQEFIHYIIGRLRKLMIFSTNDVLSKSCAHFPRQNNLKKFILPTPVIVFTPIWKLNAVWVGWIFEYVYF